MFVSLLDRPKRMGGTRTKTAILPDAHQGRREVTSTQQSERTKRGETKRWEEDPGGGRRRRGTCGASRRAAGRVTIQRPGGAGPREAMMTWEGKIVGRRRRARASDRVTHLAVDIMPPCPSPLPWAKECAAFWSFEVFRLASYRRSTFNSALRSSYLYPRTPSSDQTEAEVEKD